MVVFLFGPPGSGKGTQAKDLAARLGIPHVATGDIFRKHLREGTELGLQVRGFLANGQLVPDSVTCDLVATRLAEPDARDGVLLDGFPRTVPQAEWLVGWLGQNGRRVDGVVSLEVPDALILERLTGRRSCAQCGASFHAVYNPPVNGQCGNCGSTNIVQRPDDSDAVVQDRLAVYARDTAPVLAVLGRAGPVHALDGTGEIRVVKARIFGALGL